MGLLSTTLVEQLASSDDRESARQELLLAKDRADGPLLDALDDPAYAAARPELAGALLSLMIRVDDPRIHTALSRHLVTDTNPRVRARIAHGLGLHRRAEGAAALIQAMRDDEDIEVRYQALLALDSIGDKLTDDQSSQVDTRALDFVADPHVGIRMEAKIRVDKAVAKWMKQGERRELKAEMAAAESLYSHALAYYPGSKRANYRLGRFYYDNGRQQKGIAVLREHGMLLDVPRFSDAPEIDGRLDDEVWSHAAQADTFYQLSGRHGAALVSQLRSRLYVGYTDDALYIGFYGFDDDPANLLVVGQNFDDEVWWEDVIEIFFDADFDHLDYMQVGINSKAVMADNWYDGVRSRDEARFWNAAAEAAAYVGDDFWSVEYRLNFGQPELPRPTRGTVWGFNLSRTYRNSEYAQWVRMSEALAPNEFGLLLFE